MSALTHASICTIPLSSPTEKGAILNLRQRRIQLEAGSTILAARHAMTTNLQRAFPCLTTIASCWRQLQAPGPAAWPSLGPLKSPVTVIGRATHTGRTITQEKGSLP